MNYTIEDIIEHHGVKGMKWGVRKDRRSSGAAARRNTRATPKPPPKKTEEKRVSSKKFKAKDATKLSDQELRERVNRLNMEKQYRDLISKQNPPGTVSRGVKAVGRILTRSGETALTKYFGKAVFPVLINKAASRSRRLPAFPGQ